MEKAHMRMAIKSNVLYKIVMLWWFLYPWKRHSHLKLKGCESIKTWLIMFLESIKETVCADIIKKCQKSFEWKTVSQALLFYRQTDVFILRTAAVQPEQRRELLRYAGQLGSGEHSQYGQQRQRERHSGHGAVRRPDHQQLRSVSDWRKLHGRLRPSQRGSDH